MNGRSRNALDAESSTIMTGCRAHRKQLRTVSKETICELNLLVDVLKMKQCVEERHIGELLQNGLNLFKFPIGSTRQVSFKLSRFSNVIQHERTLEVS